jgi:enoyl-CoA hydratase/carnithine racemase
MGNTALAPVLTSRRGGVLRLRLSRPDRHNALDTSTLNRLVELLQPPAGAAPVLVLEGDGQLFSVGSDIAELAAADSGQARAYSRLAHEAVRCLEAWPAVTVANLSGYCLGSALELALGCDLLVGSADVRLGLPGLAWAMVPCMGGLRRLRRRGGGDLASRLFLAGEVIDGNEGMATRLLDRLVDTPFDIDQLVVPLLDYTSAAVHAIRGIRLERQGRDDCESEASLFAQPFASGETQKRLKALLAG